jgi:hypothetical protein
MVPDLSVIRSISRNHGAEKRTGERLLGIWALGVFSANTGRIVHASKVLCWLFMLDVFVWEAVQATTFLLLVSWNIFCKIILLGVLYRVVSHGPSFNFPWSRCLFGQYDGPGRFSFEDHGTSNSPKGTKHKG